MANDMNRPGIFVATTYRACSMFAIASSIDMHKCYSTWCQFTLCRAACRRWSCSSRLSIAITFPHPVMLSLATLSEARRRSTAFRLKYHSTCAAVVWTQEADSESRNSASTLLTNVPKLRLTLLAQDSSFFNGNLVHILGSFLFYRFPLHVVMKDW